MFRNLCLEITIIILILNCLTLFVMSTDKYTHLKFTDDWSTMFPNCSYTHNKFLSPIDIETRKAIDVGKMLPTLTIYSFEPMEGYSLQTWVNDTKNKIVMGALTIILDEKTNFQATYIKGIGLPRSQLFQSATIFFSKEGSGQPFHRIDGEAYPMEIKVTFTNQKQGSDTETIETQLFILVKLQNNNNPNFDPIIEAGKEILKMKSKNEQIQILQTYLEEKEKTLKNLSSIYKKDVMEQLEPVIEEVEEAIDVIETETHNLEKALQLLEKNNKSEEIDEYKKKFQILLETIHKEQNSYNLILDELQFKANSPVLRYEKFWLEDSIKRKKKLAAATASHFEHLISQQLEREYSIQKLNQNIDFYNLTIKYGLELIAEWNWESKPTNGETLFEFYIDQLELEEKIHNIEEEIEKLKVRLNEANVGWKVNIERFQISWLFPDMEGVYIYNGSNPLPPCNPVNYSIVMKAPIGISQKQFDILASIPPYDGFELSQNVVPRLAPLGQRLIWYNPKDIQWDSVM